jgi:hypothetical protein
MDIHKPKPWHGVREFLKEYAIIVVGVLTALGAEQAAEWGHRTEEVAQARKALHREIAYDARAALIGAREDGCYRDLLLQYAAWARGGPKPAFNLGRLSLPDVRTPVWDVAKSTAVANMDLDERFAFASFYGQAANQNTLVANTRTASGQLAGYAFLDRLSPEQAGALLQDIGMLRTLLVIKSGNWGALVSMARKLGVEPEPAPAGFTARVDDVCAGAGGGAEPKSGSR